MIEWCERNLPFADVAVTGMSPPLPYGADAFDLVYAFSVFTTSRSRSTRMDRECRRVLRPAATCSSPRSASTTLSSIASRAPSSSPSERQRRRAVRTIRRHEPVQRIPPTAVRARPARRRVRLRVVPRSRGCGPTRPAPVP
jgi:hypothetical protein